VDFKNVTRPHFGLPDMAQCLDRAIGAHYPIDADLPRLSAGHAERAVLAAIGQDAGGHGLEETNTTDAAIAALPFACAAGTAADLVALQSHGEAELQYLGIGHSRVGHVHLDHAGAIETTDDASFAIQQRTRTAAARNGFVILVARVAKGEVVHRALAGRHDAQRTEQRVRDAGRSFNVACHD
jgi:hypothetical protein